MFTDNKSNELPQIFMVNEENRVTEKILQKTLIKFIIVYRRTKFSLSNLVSSKFLSCSFL